VVKGRCDARGREGRDRPGTHGREREVTGIDSKARYRVSTWDPEADEWELQRVNLTGREVMDVVHSLEGVWERELSILVERE
jgi:hypothetical protein